MKQDFLWEAFCNCKYGEPSPILTKTERSVLNGALKQLREVSATPEQVTARCKEYQRKFPGMTLTPTALCKHWTSLAVPPRKPSSQMHDTWNGPAKNGDDSQMQLYLSRLNKQGI